MIRLRPVLVVHYHEISLKRGNRPLFLRHLRHNLESALADVGPAPVQQLSGRIVIDLEGNPTPDAVRDRVTRVFGVASATVAYRAPSTLDAMKGVLGRLLEGRSFPSFRISARRAFKTYPLTSVELNRALGAFVLDQVPTRVDLEHASQDIASRPAAETFISWTAARPRGAARRSQRHRRRALSAGSMPVAAWRMMKRGCRVVFVHSTACRTCPPPRRPRPVRGERLTAWQYASRLHLVPLARSSGTWC